MKDNRLSFWNTQLGNFVLLELLSIAALLFVGLLFYFIPGFSSFFEPVQTILLEKPISMFFVMAIMMQIPFSALAILMALATPKYNAHTHVKGPNFPVPFYHKDSAFGDQPQLDPHDYKSNGKKFTPVWKDNYQWHDVLMLDSSYNGKCMAFSSTKTGIYYLVHPDAMRYVAPLMKDGMIESDFTFLRIDRTYTVCPAKTGVKSD
jgi:hypothetical protein